VVSPALEVTDRRRQRLIIFSVAFASFMVNLDTYIVNISLPAIARHFGASTSHVAWVMLSYHLIVTSLLVVVGKLGDRLGLKRVYQIGFGVFTLSSLLCGLAPSLGVLIAGRFVQGAGASMLYALTPAMIPRFLPERRRGPSYGTLATAAALGITLGTPLGGIITGLSSWHWIFLINLPVGVAAMLVCHRVIPDDHPDRSATAPARFDVTGALLVLVGSLGLMLVLSMGEHAGWRSPTILCGLAAAVTALGLFVWWELRTPQPLLDVRLFSSRAFTLGSVAGLLGCAFLAGHNFLMPFYLQLCKGLSPQTAGSVFLSYSVLYMLLGPFAGKLTLKVSPRIMCTVAMGLCTLTAATFAGTLALPSLAWVIVYFVGLAAAFSAFFTASNSAIIGTAPAGKQGVVSGTFGTICRFGLALGVCTFEVALTVATGAAGSGKDVFAGVTRDTLTHGFRWAYLVGAGLCLLAMLVSALAVQRRCTREQL
jgi:EmrB/QacA subfamily drug resistance transporter